ncbi:hypothetical protein EON65_41670 [archaeon]|nr:MAG: hypothetical protein EON65_41670 [archaeon]
MSASVETIDLTYDTDNDISDDCSTDSSWADSETIGSMDTADLTLYDVHFGSITSPKAYKAEVFVDKHESRLRVLQNIRDAVAARIRGMSMMDVVVLLSGVGTKYCLRISGNLTFWRHDPMWSQFEHVAVRKLRRRGIRVGSQVVVTVYDE